MLIRIEIVFPVDTGNPNKQHTSIVNRTDLPSIIYPLLKVSGLYSIMTLSGDGDLLEGAILPNYNASTHPKSTRYSFANVLTDAILLMCEAPGPFLDSLPYNGDVSEALNDDELREYKREIYMSALGILAVLATRCREYPLGRISVWTFLSPEEKADQDQMDVWNNHLANEMGPI